MDCWYKILNCIPRYELRQGGGTDDEERAAFDQYAAVWHRDGSGALSSF